MSKPSALFNRHGLMALLLSAALAGALLWWFPVGWVTVAAVAGTTVLAIAVWLVIYHRSGAYDQAHAAARSDIEQRAVAELGRDLVALGETKGAEQLEMLQRKRDDLLTVLRARFGAAELTYMRYAQTAELVYGAAIENLRETVVAHNSVKSIDVQRLEEKLTTLRADDADSAAEIAALQSRRTLHRNQVDKVRTRLAENEAALTALSNTATALADTKTGVTGETLDAESAIVELERLAARAGRYEQS